MQQQLLQYCKGIPECRVVLLQQQVADQAAQLVERDQQAARLQPELADARQQLEAAQQGEELRQSTATQ